MKSLIAIAFSLLTLTASAHDLGAVDSLLSVLPLGTHKGYGCAVTVSEVEYPVRSAYVRVTNKDTTIFKIIKDGSDFFFTDFRKEFIQTEYVTIDDTRSSSVERIIRTFIVDEKKLYVVVEESVTVNRDRRAEIAECIVTIN